MIDQDNALDLDNEADDEVIAAVTRTLREPVAVNSRLEFAIMAQVRAAAAEQAAAVPAPRAVPPAPGRLAALTAWWRQPRTLTLSPLTGLACAMAFGGVVVLSAWFARETAPTTMIAAAPAAEAEARDGVRGGTMPVAMTASNGAQMVRFSYVAPADAQAVSLVGTFNDWDPNAARLTPVERDGVWTVDVPLLGGQTYQYVFVVTNEAGEERWLADPNAPSLPADEFGQPRSALTLARSSS